MSTSPRAVSSAHFSGFTLVELIVVITILAILGVIGFIAIQGYTSRARDSERVSDIATLSKALDVAVAAGSALPAPENPVSVLANGVVIGAQGTVGKTVFSRIGFGGNGRDPLDSNYYTYLTNAAATRYQLAGFTENGALVSLLPGVATAYAANYSGRQVFSRGMELGILTASGSEQPIQELVSGSFTGVDIITATGGTYRAYINSSKILSGSGPVLWEVWGRLDASIGIYPGCDTVNMRLPNGQIWASCNVGATQASTATGSAFVGTGSVMGQFFQHGRNDILTIDPSNGTNYLTGTLALPGNTSVGHNLFITGDPTWMNTPWVTDNWGGAASTFATGTYQSLNMPASMKGPCATGYHVPTAKEWSDAGLSIAGN